MEYFMTPDNLIRNGNSAWITDANLLEMIAGKKAAELLADYTLRDLLNRDISELAPRIGKANAKKLVAALELTRRIESAPYDSHVPIRSARDVVAHYIPRCRQIMKETFFVLFLNTHNKVFREETVSTGSLNASVVHPREVFRNAITERAASIILMHNHPSGNPEPSQEDIKITQQLKQAGLIVGIKVLDHIIIASESFLSFSEKGLL
jgi:DNA repair protein RadC